MGSFSTGCTLGLGLDLDLDLACVAVAYASPTWEGKTKGVPVAFLAKTICKLLLRLTLRHMCRSTLDQACAMLGMSVGGVGYDS